MQIGIVGLGRMGGNMARRLSRGGVRVTGYDPSAAAAQALAKEGAIEAAASLQALAAALPMPRVFWMMVPAGDATETTFEALLALASPGDLVVDGGNAHYKDSERRAAAVSLAPNISA